MLGDHAFQGPPNEISTGSWTHDLLWCAMQSRFFFRPFTEITLASFLRHVLTMWHIYSVWWMTKLFLFISLSFCKFCSMNFETIPVFFFLLYFEKMTTDVQYENAWHILHTAYSTVWCTQLLLTFYCKSSFQCVESIFCMCFKYTFFILSEQLSWTNVALLVPMGKWHSMFKPIGCMVNFVVRILYSRYLSVNCSLLRHSWSYWVFWTREWVPNVVLSFSSSSLDLLSDFQWTKTFSFLNRS